MLTNMYKFVSSVFKVHVQHSAELSRQFILKLYRGAGMLTNKTVWSTLVPEVNQTWIVQFRETITISDWLTGAERIGLCK